MSNKSTYVAFSNQKGGVGKSVFTPLVASYLHYTGNKNGSCLKCVDSNIYLSDYMSIRFIYQQI